MGILGFISGLFAKDNPPKDESQVTSPITFVEEKHLTIEDASKDSQEYLAYRDKIHNDNVASFDYKNPQPTDGAPLTCVERSFLKYICGRSTQNTEFAMYWTLQYKIQYGVLMSKYFNRGLLTTGCDVSRFTVPMLKDLLRMRGLPVKGKKADLLARIEGHTRLSAQEAHAFIRTERYMPTEEGRKIIAATPNSVTKDPDFEDEVLRLIQDHQLDAAYNKVMEWKNKYPVVLGLNINLENHKLSKIQHEEFTKLLIESPDNVVASCTIFLRMLGDNKEIPLLKRLGHYTEPTPKPILFTKEEVAQHEKIFFSCWEDVLRKEDLTVKAKKLANGWRFLWNSCQIGQIGFTQYGHWMQWFENAYVIDWKVVREKTEDEQDRYFHDASGKFMKVECLNLHECIDKIPYWIQYTRVMIDRRRK